MCWKQKVDHRERLKLCSWLTSRATTGRSIAGGGGILEAFDHLNVGKLLDRCYVNFINCRKVKAKRSFTWQIAWIAILVESCMVITKCTEAAAKLTRAFTNREVNKMYLAQCVRAQRMWRKTRIESGHGRSRYGAWRDAKHDVGRRLPGDSALQDMVTRVEIPAGTDLVKQDVQAGGDCEWVEVVVGSEDEVKLVGEESWDDKAQGVTVVRAFPETGRTHQIRLHCQYLGLPLYGDVKYGGPLEWQGVRYDSHAFHAESLTFSHPITKKLLSIVAPCPTWAAQLGVEPFQFQDS